MMGKILIFTLSIFFGGYNLFVHILSSFTSSKYETYRASDEGTVHNAYVLLDTLSLDSTKKCIDCHDDHIVGEVVHAPARKDCTRCHISNGKEHPIEKVEGFDLKQDVPGLCYECHDPKNDAEFVHDPSEKGDCILCHDIHTSENLYLVKSNPISKICYDCHDLKIPKENFIHGAVKDGECVGCHNPHQADNKNFIANSKLDRLCKKCHKGVRKEFKKEHVHAPFKKKNCFDCHKPHSSKEPHLSDMKAKDLCLSCHEDVHDQINSASVVHGALGDSESCLKCHASHSSNYENIMKYENVEMCLRCHQESIRTKTGKIEAIGPHLKEGNFIHGAITDDGCSVCHSSHVAERQDLLVESFPPKVYAQATENNYLLCFKCHDKEILFVEKTDTITNFRDGDVNLHFLHMNGKQARNCTSCHDIHGSINLHLIKESTMFGRWEMPVRYKLIDNGGSCLTGCHAEKRYIRSLPDTIIKK